MLRDSRGRASVIPDRAILATAQLCIKRHRESAGYYAASRADELQQEGAYEGAKTWHRILADIERLQALEPQDEAQ